MTHGSLDVQTVNASTEVYRVLFIPLGGAPGAVQHQKDFDGLDGLRAYLDSLINPRVSAERRQRMLDDWMLEVRSRGAVSLPSVEITEQQERDLLTR